MAFQNISPVRFSKGNTSGSIVAVEENENDFILKINVTAGFLRMPAKQNVTVLGTSRKDTYPTFKLQRNFGFINFGTGEGVAPSYSPAYIKFEKTSENVNILKSVGLILQDSDNYPAVQFYIKVDLTKYLHLATNFHFSTSSSSPLAGGVRL